MYVWHSVLQQASKLHTRKSINTLYEKKNKKKKRKAKRGSLVLRRVWGIFFVALEGSSRFGCDEEEAKSGKSNEFPCKKKKELGPRNTLNDSQADFYFSQSNVHSQC